MEIMERKGFLISSILVIAVTLLNGCQGYDIQAASQGIVVNEDLSGTLSRGIALTTADYQLAASYFGVPDPSENIGWKAP